MSTLPSTFNVNPNDFGCYIFGNNTDIISVSGSHLFYIAGSFDTLTSAGGSEMVLANGGNNTINLSGSGNNTVYLSGGNNVVNAGAGHNAITDAGSTGDTIVMPSAGSGFDAVTLLFGGDAKLDFTAALKGTTWGGNVANLASYISVGSGGGGTTVLLSATANGTATGVASIDAIGGPQWNLSTVLAHVVS